MRFYSEPNSDDCSVRPCLSDCVSDEQDAIHGSGASKLTEIQPARYLVAREILSIPLGRDDANTDQRNETRLG